MSQIEEHIAIDLLGVGIHAMGRSQKNSITLLMAQPPRPPFWKNKYFYVYGVFIVVLLAFASWDIFMRIQTYQNQQELVKLEKEFVKKLELKKIAQATISEGSRLQTQIKKKEKSLTYKERKSAILKQLLYKQDQITSVLTVLQDTLSDEVFLTKFIQSAQEQYYLSGWAITNTAAQLIVNNLERDLKQLNLKVEDRIIESGTNYLGSSGYYFKIWLKVN